MSFESIQLIADGVSDYTLVVSADSPISEKHAADEFRYFLREISGVDLPVVMDNQQGKHRIYIGKSRSVLQLLNGYDPGLLGQEGFLIRTVGSDLIILGGNPRGTLYGVYAFLEEILGCRWYTPKFSLIPKKNEVSIPPLNIIQKPAFDYREPHFMLALDADWCARNRCNGSFAPLKAIHGGHDTYGREAWVHTLEKLVPVSVYYKDHPEYFALMDGKRLDEYEQVCMSNPEVKRIVTEGLIRWIEEEPEADHFSISQNDNFNYCQCDECMKIAEEEGSYSGVVIRFVNAIADEIAQRYPDKWLDTLAYHYSKIAPEKTVPAQNIRIGFCPIDKCKAHSYECSKNIRYAEALEGWLKITSNVYIWHYGTNFMHYLQPFPDWDEMANDLRFYRQKGVMGIYALGNYNGSGIGEFSELRAYLYSKLLWNPEIDSWIVVDDFLDNFYGKAGRLLRAYLDLITSTTKDSNLHIGIYDTPTTSNQCERIYLTPEILAEVNRLFDEAERVIAEDPVELSRVKQARLSIRYTELMQAIARDPKMAWSEAMDELVADCKYFGVTNFCEWKTIDESLRELRA